VITRLGLTLNEAKTSIRQAAQGKASTFWGTRSGRTAYRKDGHWYLGASPARRRLLESRRKWETCWCPSTVGVARKCGSAESDVARLVGYYSYGTRMPAYRAVDNYVYQSVRNFLRRRHKVQSRGTGRFSDEVVFGELGTPTSSSPFGTSFVSLR